jgi:streptomycin 6-kinase
VIDLPPAVRNNALAADRADWLDALPDVLDDLRTTWAVTTGRVFGDATEALVCEAIRADGTEAVVKIPVPTETAVVGHEHTVLRLADGVGCARLLEYAPPHRALLLERLGPSLADLRLPIRRRHEILCDVSLRIWRPAPGADLPTGALKAQWLADEITRCWEQLDRPCSEAVIDQALRCARRRRDAHDDERAVLVHGDVHQWNTLRAGPHEFKLVDPDGLLAEPEYDLGIIMREDPIELMQGHPDERAHWLAARTGLDPTAIREWGIIERVSNGLLWAEVDPEPFGRRMLDAAEYVAGHPTTL